MADSDSDSGSIGSNDSDKELQVAFSHGLLKPGLNIETKPEKPQINNVEGMQLALNELRKDLPWLERLDVTMTLGPAPKALKLEEETSGDAVHNDFKREMTFYRQAQAAVLDAMPRLHKLGIPTRRPEDYFAEMAKSDFHMKKVREKLMEKQISTERSEKAKKLRELRKYGKKVQTEVLQKRQKEKKEMMDAVKRYRKGKETKLDFLEGDGSKQTSKGKTEFAPGKKREFKNKKFGFGGQKKRMKHNTKTSSSDMSGFSAKKHSSRPMGSLKRANAPTNNRPGKRRRQNIKNKGRK